MSQNTDSVREESRRWWEDRRRKLREAAEKMSAEHFAQPAATIPDLEFNTPDCPICLENTAFDDGLFICEVCRVTWPRSGYGHEATRDDDEWEGAG